MTSTTSRLRAINPIQLALILGLIYAVLALIIALFFIIFHGLVASLMPMGGGFPNPLVLLIGFPIGYFVGGFIGGLIVAALYNLVAGWTGGLELTFESQP
jgi:hypothetical protein